MKRSKNKKYPNRACPICQNKENGRVLHTQKFILAENNVLPNEYDIVACNMCGFVYADSAASQAVYDRYYADMSKYEMNYIESDTSLFIDRAAWITTFINDKSASFIDIGCGNGYLLIELQKLGFSNLTGLDPSQKCIDALLGRGIKGIAGSIFNIPHSVCHDCIILSGVLEHIYDVDSLMKMLKTIVRPQGYIFVCVPDASSYHDFDHIPFDYFNIEHINHFDETSLLNLGLLHGLRVIGLLKATITLSKVVQPVIFCIYQNAGKEAVNWKNYSATSVSEYIVKTKQNDTAQTIINKLKESGEKIIVWGAGNYAYRLLATTDLSECDIVAFVDNDRHKQGSTIGGRIIHAPDIIQQIPDKPAIFIAVAVFSDEVLSEIEKLGIKNRVIVLR